MRERENGIVIHYSDQATFKHTVGGLLLHENCSNDDEHNIGKWAD
jgi:hypothetical protein